MNQLIRFDSIRFDHASCASAPYGQQCATIASTRFGPFDHTAIKILGSVLHEWFHATRWWQ